MEDKKINKRMCISCGILKDKSEFIRVVRLKCGTYIYDKTGKAEGRGSYVCNTSDCLNKAFKEKRFNRSFKSGFNFERESLGL